MGAGLCSALSMLDASDAELDDAAAVAAADKMSEWPSLRMLRLSGNVEITAIGAEALARALLLSPVLRLADLKGSAALLESPRLHKMLEDGGADPSRMRL